MNKAFLGLTLACVGAVAHAADRSGQWYVTPSMNFTMPDSDKNLSSEVGYGLALGKYLNETWSLDLEGDVGVLDFPGEGHISQTGLGVMARYHFTGYNDFRPYVAAGLGILDHNGWAGVGNKVDSSDLMFNLGVGLRKDLTARMALQTEVKYRLDTDDFIGSNSSFDDFMFSMGLNVSLGNVSDAEPESKELVQPAPQLDSDRDGVSDANDRCPNTPYGTPVDAYGCARKMADGDDDRDGVPNSRDKCPNSRPGAVVGQDGCDVEVVIELQGVHFDVDRATLRPESIAILNSAVKTLGTHGNILVEVGGHTDSTGAAEYNQNLSERRAKVVFDYLVAHGVSADRMTWRGYGESLPIAGNDSEEGRAQNRRTELKIKD